MAEEKKVEAEVVEASTEEKKTVKKTAAKKTTTKKTAAKKSKKAEVKEEEVRVARQAILKDYTILKHMIVTEATQKLRDTDNALVFAVDKKANKLEIKAAVQAIFNAKVASVNTMNVPQKTRRVGRFSGKLPAYKKAIVRFDSSFDLGKIANEIANEERAANEEAK